MEESDGIVCIQDRLLWSTRLQATAPLIRPCCHLLLSPEVIIAKKEQREDELIIFDIWTLEVRAGVTSVQDQ